MERGEIERPWRTLVVACALVFSITGCAEKARTVQVGASQFLSESNAAIDGIDALRRAEVTAPPLPAAEAADKFVQLVEGSKQPITGATLAILLNPGAIATPGNEQEWQALLGKLRGQYAAFAAIFGSLDRGSLLAAPDVKRAIPLLDPLTAQMAAFAKTLQANPAVFIAERAALAADLEQARDDARLTADQRRAALLRLRQRLLDVAAAEQRITAETTVQCLKAARLGLALRKLLAAYDTLTSGDLMEGLAVAFQVAGSVSGRDLSGLQARTDGVVAELTATPELKALFDTALGEVGAGITKARAASAS